MEWPRHGNPLNAGAGFVHVLDRVLIPPQVLEHGVYGVHSDHWPSTGTGTANERGVSLSIGPSLEGGGFWETRFEIWGGERERAQLLYLRSLLFLHLSSPQPPPPPPPPPNPNNFRAIHTPDTRSGQRDLSLFIANSMKAALGIRKLLFGGHSSNSLHCSICSNAQWPITRATFFDLAVTKTYEMGAGIQVKASLWDVIYTVL